MKYWIRVLVASCSLLFTSSCDDVRTGYAYDKSADFSGLATYSWVGRKDVEMSAPNHHVIVAAIRSELETKGLQTVDLVPDLYVTYFADQDEQVRVNIRRRGYSYGTDWYWAGGLQLTLGGSATEVRTFEEGSLVVDIYSAATNQLIWRGVATATVGQDPGKMAQVVRRAVSKLLESYPPPIEVKSEK
jgi:hypothetical protein